MCIANPRPTPNSENLSSEVSPHIIAPSVSSYPFIITSEQKKSICSVIYSSSVSLLHCWLYDSYSTDIC